MVHDFGDNALLDPPVNANATTDSEDNYLICQRSGFKIPVSEGLIQDGDRPGLWVRKEDYDPFHPQRLVRSRAETGKKGSVAPEQPDRFPDPITPDDL
jgi:hypothetical protein